MRSLFQSLTRDSNHSNLPPAHVNCRCWTFQSLTRDSNHSNFDRRRLASKEQSFNPSRGIAIIQTLQRSAEARARKFQSLTRDSNHSNPLKGWNGAGALLFQSLTRDSNHSNYACPMPCGAGGWFQSLTRDSNHSNLGSRSGSHISAIVSIPHAG